MTFCRLDLFFFLYLMVADITALARPQKALDDKMTMLKYSVGFGDQNTKSGAIFLFEDFELVFEGMKELSFEEKQLKQKSIAEGIDGGVTMLSPSYLFLIVEKSGARKRVELMTLPYAKAQFTVGSKKFELKNLISQDAQWIIDDKKAK